ncbi:MAG: BA14K family protein [Rhodobiaceae bacterium]|nr:BA14K family protein [Rhodobiaceae bacterium]
MNTTKTATTAIAALTGAALLATAAVSPAEAKHWHHHNGAAALGGFAAGALFGAAVAQPRYYAPAPVYVEPAPVYYYDRHDARCAARYQSYNPATNTWIDFKGRVRVCRL